MGEKYEKLVRDNIPDILDGKNITYEQRTASPEEYRLELIKKLDEEVQEFKEAGSIEELADVLEVIDALLQLPEYQNVAEIQNQKRGTRGAFAKRLILKGEKG